MPEAAFGDFNLFVGDTKLCLNALVFAAHHCHLGARFHDLIAELLRVVAQFSICGKKLGLFQFQQAFRRQTRATFLCQLVGQTHPDLRILSRGQSRIMVKKKLTRPLQVIGYFVSVY